MWNWHGFHLNLTKPFDKIPRQAKRENKQSSIISSNRVSILMRVRVARHFYDFLSGRGILANYASTDFQILRDWSYVTFTIHAGCL